MNYVSIKPAAEESEEGERVKQGEEEEERLPGGQGLDQTMILTRFSLGNLLASFLVSLSWKRNQVFSQTSEL